jgi:hypothetical protein
VSNILLKVENAGAEKLLNYFIAYRRMTQQNNERLPSSANLTLGVLPQLKIKASKPKKNLKRHF